MVNNSFQHTDRNKRGKKKKKKKKFFPHLSITRGELSGDCSELPGAERCLAEVRPTSLENASFI
jgi:hypothetical protein